MSELILTNARIVTADAVVAGTLTVRTGLIASIDEGRSSLPGAIDCGGDLVIPGLVELHTDNLEGHLKPRPGVAWPAASAIINHDRQLAAAGITTVLNALYVGEIYRDGTRGDVLRRACPAIRAQMAAGALKIDHHLHLRCEVSYPRMVELLQPLLADPGLRMLSLNDHTPGQRQFVRIEKYIEYYQGRYRLSDAEMQAFMLERRATQAEFGACNRDYVVAAARARNLPLASHDDATTEHVADAARDRVTVAEFPTTLSAAQACRDHGIAVMMGGPNLVRGGSHSGNVSAVDLAMAGLLDIVSSDYVPSSMLHGALQLADHGIALPQAIATVTRTPAQRIGLDDRGEIAIGKRADLVRVQPMADAPVVQDVWRGGTKIA